MHHHIPQLTIMRQFIKKLSHFCVYYWQKVEFFCQVNFFLKPLLEYDKIYKNKVL